MPEALGDGPPDVNRVLGRRRAVLLCRLLPRRNPLAVVSVVTACECFLVREHVLPGGSSTSSERHTVPQLEGVKGHVLVPCEAPEAHSVEVPPDSRRVHVDVVLALEHGCDHARAGILAALAMLDLHLGRGKLADHLPAGLGGLDQAAGPLRRLAGGSAGLVGEPVADSGGVAVEGSGDGRRSAPSVGSDADSVQVGVYETGVGRHGKNGGSGRRLKWRAVAVPGEGGGAKRLSTGRPGRGWAGLR